MHRGFFSPIPVLWYLRVFVLIAALFRTETDSTSLSTELLFLPILDSPYLPIVSPPLLCGCLYIVTSHQHSTVDVHKPTLLTHATVLMFTPTSLHGFCVIATVAMFETLMPFPAFVPS